MSQELDNLKAEVLNLQAVVQNAIGAIASLKAQLAANDDAELAGITNALKDAESQLTAAIGG